MPLEKDTEQGCSCPAEILLGCWMNTVWREPRVVSRLQLVSRKAFENLGSCLFTLWLLAVLLPPCPERQPVHERQGNPTSSLTGVPMHRIEECVLCVLTHQAPGSIYYYNGWTDSGYPERPRSYCSWDTVSVTATLETGKMKPPLGWEGLESAMFLFPYGPPELWTDTT